MGDIRMTLIPKNHTHTVYAYQRTGKKHGRMLECGSGRIDPVQNAAHVVMNRQPLGGYTGYILLLPFGVKPTPQATEPEQIEQSDGDHAEG
jgi:hypothetical protein